MQSVNLQLIFTECATIKMLRHKKWRNRVMHNTRIKDVQAAHIAFLMMTGLFANFDDFKLSRLQMQLSLIVRSSVTVNL